MALRRGRGAPCALNPLRKARACDGHIRPLRSLSTRSAVSCRYAVRLPSVIAAVLLFHALALVEPGHLRPSHAPVVIHDHVAAHDDTARSTVCDRELWGLPLADAPTLSIITKIGLYDLLVAVAAVVCVCVRSGGGDAMETGKWKTLRNARRKRRNRWMPLPPYVKGI